MLPDGLSSLFRLAAGVLLCAGLPQVQAAGPAVPLGAEAARAAIGQVLATPAFARPLFSWEYLAAGAVIATVLALAVALAPQLWRRRGPSQWPSPAYSPMTPPATVEPVIAAAERAWPAAPKAALDLLYQGLLARLASDYQMAVPPGATEPEVLAQVASLRLSALEDFTHRLLELWQQATYADAPPDAAAWSSLVVAWQRLFPTDVNP